MPPHRPRAIQHAPSESPPDSDVEHPLSQEETDDSDSSSDEDELVRNLRKALSDSQKVAMQYQKENTKLKAEIATLTVQQPVLSKGRRKKITSGDPVVAGIEEDIEKLGRFFQLFYSPFIESASFTHPRPAFDYDHPNRFSEDSDELLGTVAELYACIPEKYHKVMREYQGFNIKFIAALEASRPLAILRLRNNAGKILGLPPAYFDTKPEMKRSDMPLVRQLLGISQHRTSGLLQYAILPPIFYKNGDDSRSKGLFLNEALIKAARLLLYGPTALTSGRSILRSNSPYSRPDHPATTTLGLITWTMVFWRFILSDDTEFPKTGIGASTGINYQADLTFYKKAFIESRDEQPKWITYVLKKWNEEVFPNVVQGTHPEGHGNDAEEVQDTANHLTNHLMRLRLEEDPVDSSASSPEEEFPAQDNEHQYLDFGEGPSLRAPKSFEQAQPIPPPPSSSGPSEVRAESSRRIETVPEGGSENNDLSPPSLPQPGTTEAMQAIGSIRSKKKKSAGQHISSSNNTDDAAGLPAPNIARRKPSSTIAKPGARTTVGDANTNIFTVETPNTGTLHRETRRSAKSKGKEKAN